MIFIEIYGVFSKFSTQHNLNNKEIKFTIFENGVDIFWLFLTLSLQSLKMILILFWLIGLPTLLWWRSVSWCWPQSVMPSSKWWWKLAVRILSLQISLRRNTVTPWSYSRPCSSSPTQGQRSWHEPWDWGLDNSYWTRYFNGNHSYLKHTNINMALSLNV